MNRCFIPISIGELWDKYTILLIKKEKIQCTEKLGHVNKEIEELLPFVERFPIEKELLDRIHSINKTLWELEDAIRDKDRLGDFGPEFITISRNIYQTNDNRYNAKREINTYHNSTIMEVKSYKKHGSDI